MYENVKRSSPMGMRFEFCKNWARFLALADDKRIATAERSLKGNLEWQSPRRPEFS